MKLNFYPSLCEIPGTPEYQERQNRLALNPKNHNNFFVFLAILIFLSYIFYKCSFNGQ